MITCPGSLDIAEAVVLIENCDFWSLSVDTLRPEKNDHHFTDIFKYFCLNEKFCIFIQIVSEGPIDNKSSKVKVIAWMSDKQQAIICTN